MGCGYKIRFCTYAEEDACDLATALVLQNGVSFEHNPDVNKNFTLMLSQKQIQRFGTKVKDSRMGKTK